MLKGIDEAVGELNNQNCYNDVDFDLEDMIEKAKKMEE